MTAPRRSFSHGARVPDANFAITALRQDLDRLALPQTPTSNPSSEGWSSGGLFGAVTGLVPGGG